MIPFRILPVITSVLWIAVIGAGISAALYIATELHAGGKAQCEATHAEAERDAVTQASQQASEAATARETAFKRGSVGRLRAEWCGDCQEAANAR